MKKEKRNKRLSLMLVFVLLALTMTGCGGGSSGGNDAGSSGDAAEPIVLRLASDAPTEHLATILNKEACEEVFERTEGRVKIDYYGSSQLGSYETIYNEIMLGSVDIAQVCVSDSLDPRLGFNYITCIAHDYEDAKVMLQPGSFLFERYKELNAEFGVTFLGFLMEGFIGMATIKEPKDPFIPGADKKMKLRSPSLLVSRVMVEELGYSPVTTPYSEVPTALQTGVVDGWFGGTPNINYSWVGDIINYYYMNFVQQEATSYIMSDLSLAKLSEEDAKILKEVFAEKSLKSFELAEENDNNYLQKLADEHGVEIHMFTEEQLEAQTEYAKEHIWPKYEELFSKEWVDAVYDEVKTARDAR